MKKEKEANYKGTVQSRVKNGKKKKALGSGVTFQWSLGQTTKNTECWEPLNP